MSTSVFDSVLLKNLWSTEEMRQIFLMMFACKCGWTMKPRWR